MSKAEAKSLKINQAVLNLICGTGIPPTIIDTDEWKNVVSAIDKTATTYGSTSFVDMYIPGKVGRITEEDIQVLSTVENLTISYDGSTTKAVESIYTIHVTTPRHRQTDLIEGNEASGMSHSGPQISNKLFKTFEGHGSHWHEKLSGISSDSTGNTELVCEIVAKAIPWVINLPYVCHLLNNTAKDIGKIPFFANTITRLHSIIKYFRKSSYAKQHLTALQIYLDFKEGHVLVGNTWFSLGGGVAKTVPCSSQGLNVAWE
ncbi:hypothetical protein JB92DRAFT_2834574 [Gautieria morchelliformis]|nr:hypothetical protein JB92DRAFT_2834574 [Gautieria morchelliformis]